MNEFKIIFGAQQPDGNKAAYMQHNGKEVFICWYHKDIDKQGKETKVQSIERLLKQAGYTSNEDYWQEAKAKWEGK